MRILEFGDSSKPMLLLIHGFQCPWQVWDKYIQHYQADYHVLVPILSGHDPKHPEDFESFARDAQAIEDYIIPRYGHQVHGVYAMSMGGVLAATLWQNRKLAFDRVIFDGSPLVSCGKLVKGFMERFYLMITHKCQQRDAKALRQATQVLVPEEKLDTLLAVLDQMTDATVINSISGIADFRLKTDVDTKNTQLCFFHGTAANEMLAKQSAKLLQKYYPSAMVKCFKGKFHCEDALFHPERIIAELDAIW